MSQEGVAPFSPFLPIFFVIEKQCYKSTVYNKANLINGTSYALKCSEKTELNIKKKKCLLYSNKVFLTLVMFIG
jgi:hypothetical protein